MQDTLGEDGSRELKLMLLCFLCASFEIIDNPFCAGDQQPLVVTSKKHCGFARNLGYINLIVQ